MAKQKEPKVRKRDELDRLCDWLQFKGIQAVIVEEEVERRGFFRRLFRAVAELEFGQPEPRRFIKLEDRNIDAIYLRPVGGTGTRTAGYMGPF